jgi:hypothetical protein
MASRIEPLRNLLNFAHGTVKSNPANVSVIAIITNHHSYHAGEMNQILSIKRGKAWEEGEEVEENHISTVGHRVKPPWKN